MPPPIIALSCRPASHLLCRLRRHEDEGEAAELGEGVGGHEGAEEVLHAGGGRGHL